MSVPVPGGSSYPGLDIGSLVINPDNTDSTKVIITVIPKISGFNIALSYKAEVVLASTSSFTSPLNSPTVFSTSPINPIAITGLIAGKSYKVRVTAYSGTGATGTSGINVTQSFQIPVSANNSSVDAFSNLPKTQVAVYGYEEKSSSNSFKVNKSLFTINNTSSSDLSFSAAYKLFEEIPTPSGESYYSFATTLFFNTESNVQKQSAGFAFFTDARMSNAYVIKIDTTGASGSANTKHEISFLKVIGNEIIPIDDSQSSETSFVGVLPGKSYKIQISVKHTDTSNFITMYINGYKITATDTVNLVSVTKNIGMISFSGKVSFDYVSGMGLSPEQYKKNVSLQPYGGTFEIIEPDGETFSSNSLSFLSGKTVLSINNPNSISDGRIEEFGPIAREIKKVDIKFETRPAFPLRPSVGINPFAKILASNLTPFGAEVYVLNNSGTFIPLSDSKMNSFFINGKTISKSGVLEYSTDLDNKYPSEEPIIFQSQWLQNEKDVKSLAEWIKTKWADKQLLIKLEVFGNPFISVGDIISISYGYHNLSSVKFIVTNVSQSYSEGLSTSISCRNL